MQPIATDELKQRIDRGQRVALVEVLPADQGLIPEMAEKVRKVRE